MLITPVKLEEDVFLNLENQLSRSKKKRNAKGKRIKEKEEWKKKVKEKDENMDEKILRGRARAIHYIV